VWPTKGQISSVITSRKNKFAIIATGSSGIDRAIILVSARQAVTVVIRVYWVYRGGAGGGG
jgi:hypothetical protein